MDNKLIVALGVGIYMLVMLGVGYYASKKIKSSTDFIVAGRRLPYFMATATLFATWFGGGTSMGAAGAAYQEGFMGVIADPFGAGVCLLLAGFFLVRTLRRMSLLTISDFFRIRFGRKAELIASICMIPVYMGWIGAQLVAIGTIFQSLTGIDKEIGIYLATFIVFIYTYAGGMWSVTLTDFIQMLILVFGLVAIVPAVLGELGGWVKIKAQIPAEYFHFYPRDASFKDWLWYIQLWILVGLGSLPGQDLMQRTLSSKSEKVAQNSAYTAGLMYLTIGFIPVTLGIIGSFVLPNLADSELVLPEMAMRFLNPVGVALFVGALLSAIMSSADSAILAPSSIIGQNILPNIKPNITDAQKLKWCKISVFFVTFGSLVAAKTFGVIYELMINSWAILLVALVAPLIGGIWWKKVNTPAAIASMLTGIGVWIMGLLFWSEYPADLIAAVVGTVVMIVTTFLTPRVLPMPLTDINGQPIRLQGRLGLGGALSVDDTDFDQNTEVA